MNRRNSYLIIATIVIVIAVAASTIMIMNDDEKETGYTGEWTADSGTMMYHDGKTTTDVSSLMSLKITEIKDGMFCGSLNSETAEYKIAGTIGGGKLYTEFYLDDTYIILNGELRSDDLIAMSMVSYTDAETQDKFVAYVGYVRNGATFTADDIPDLKDNVYEDGNGYRLVGNDEGTYSGKVTVSNQSGRCLMFHSEYGYSETYDTLAIIHKKVNDTTYAGFYILNGDTDKESYGSFTITDDQLILREISTILGKATSYLETYGYPEPPEYPSLAGTSWTVPEHAELYTDGKSEHNDNDLKISITSQYEACVTGEITFNNIRTIFAGILIDTSNGYRLIIDSWTEDDMSFNSSMRIVFDKDMDSGEFCKHMGIRDNVMTGEIFRDGN